MKASKQFATDHGQSHLPSQMKHVSVEVLNVIPPEGAPVVILEFKRQAADKPLYLRVRMAQHEAQSLGERLLQDWTAKLWPTLNRRRGELIDAKFGDGLTEAETAELAVLTEHADVYLARFDKPMLDALMSACSVCGVSGPEHGHWNVNDPNTHKFVSTRPTR